MSAVGALAAGVLLLAIISGGPVRGQESAVNAGGAINLGSRGLSPSSEGRPAQEQNQFEYDVRAGFATDYIYRGTNQTDHKPAVGARPGASIPNWRTQPRHFAFSIFVTVSWPLIRPHRSQFCHRLL